MIHSPSFYKRPVSILLTPDPVNLIKAWYIPPSQFTPPLSQLSPPPPQKRKVQTEVSSVITAISNDFTNYQLTNLFWKDELKELKKESNSIMKKLIKENNNTTTTTVNDIVNETLMEYQTTLMKTVEVMIATRMRIVNLKQNTFNKDYLKRTNIRM